MSGANQPTRSKNARPTTEEERQKQELEHACRLPDHDQIPPDVERGERIGTAKSIATGGKGDDACDSRDRRSHEETPKSS